MYAQYTLYLPSNMDMLDVSGYKTMETTIFEVNFKDGSKYRIFCANRNQKQRFLQAYDKIKDQAEVTDLLNGINNVNQWEKHVDWINNCPF